MIKPFIHKWKLNEFHDNIKYNNYNKRSGSVKNVKCHTTFVQLLKSKKHNIM